MSNGLFYFNSLDRYISSKGEFGLLFVITVFCRNSCFYANSENTAQMPCSAASELCLRCLLISSLRDARHKLVKNTVYVFAVT